MLRSKHKTVILYKSGGFEAYKNIDISKKKRINSNQIPLIFQ